jgi:ABC-type iron transport system FetAB permease component
VWFCGVFGFFSYRHIYKFGWLVVVEMRLLLLLEIIGVVLLVVLLFTPHLPLAIVLLVTGVGASFIRRRTKKPWKELYEGCVWGVFASAILTVALMGYLILGRQDPFGLLLAFPITAMCLFLGLLVGFVVGHKKRK